MPCFRNRVRARWRAAVDGACRWTAAAGGALALTSFACGCWAQATLTPVYRFMNPHDSTHFFTISAAERDYVIATYPTVFVYEGPVFSASTQPVPGFAPVTRFWNKQTNEHFYTISSDEVAYVQSHYPQYVLEGTAYYAPLAAANDGRTPLYRFWNDVNGEHFYTDSVAERDHISATYPQFVYEGVVYYVYDIVAPPPPGVAPTISLSASATAVTAPGQVILTATAAESGGTITRVTLYQGGVKLVDLTMAPYVYSVMLANAGNYTFTAQATDDKGATATSAAVSVQASGGSAPPPAAATDMYRLLNQATFGFTQAEAARVNSMGTSAWIDDQFMQPMSGYPDANYTILQLTSSAACTNQDPVTHQGLPATDPRNICYRDNLTPTRVQRDFYTNAVSQPDQLRQRVAWALSQIMVISTVNKDLSIAYPMTRYQNILFEQAFGNFEALLNQITLSPSMGYWLTMVNNDKGNANRQPNQNYAREIMQLFSIGLVELNQDGSPILDAQGNPIPTYDQNTIAQFANVFTGWTYPKPGIATTTKNPANFELPMVTYLDGHETAAKTLLPGPNQNIPANQTAQLDITAAIHNIFMHPNVGPFIGKQLIQHLVTSNPSPAYIARVAGVFDDNGAGVRGDMRAVVKAILMDAEARGAAAPDTFGQLREPALMITAILRSLSVPTDGAGLSVRSGTLDEPIYSSPTVFNYYPIDYTIPNSSLAGPEFGNHNTYTAVQRQNQVYSLVYHGIAVDPTVPNAVGTFINTKPYEALAGNPAAMVDALNQALMNGTFPPAAAQIVVNSIAQVPATNAVERARMAIYQMAASYHFQVQH